MGRVVLSKLFEATIALLTIVTAILTISSLLAAYIHPKHAVFLQWLGLLLPATICMNVFFFTYWLVRRKHLLLLPLCAIVANGTYITSVIQLPKPGKKNDKKTIKIMNYNTGSFKHKDVISCTKEKMISFLKQENIDIVCMQELPDLKGTDSIDFYNSFSFLPYQSIKQQEPDGLIVAVFSKYPITTSGIIKLNKSKNCAMWANLLIDNLEVRVFNCHLQTTNWNQKRPTFDNQIDLKPFKTVVDQNFKLRGDQADSIRSAVDKTPYPVILCGDFNDTPASYTYHRIKGSLTDSFKSSGQGYRYTYRYLKKLFRIDYIFFSGNDFKGISNKAPSLHFSDHKPVIAEICISNKEQE